MSSGQLVPRGRDDLRHLAARLRTWFPALLAEEHVLDGRIQFVTSSKHRCVSSVEAFQQGLQARSSGQQGPQGPVARATGVRGQRQCYVAGYYCVNNFTLGQR